MGSGLAFASQQGVFQARRWGTWRIRGLFAGAAFVRRDGPITAQPRRGQDETVLRLREPYGMKRDSKGIVTVVRWAVSRLLKKSRDSAHSEKSAGRSRANLPSCEEDPRASRRCGAAGGAPEGNASPVPVLGAERA
jgi:hypothetical protein